MTWEEEIASLTAECQRLQAAFDAERQTKRDLGNRMLDEKERSEKLCRLIERVCERPHLLLDAEWLAQVHGLGVQAR